MSLVREEIKKAAREIHYGNEKCKERSKFFLSQVGMPNGLLSLKDIEESGYVCGRNRLCLATTEKKVCICYEKIGKLVSYGTEVAAYVEKGRIKKLTGVKTKELFMWVTLSDIYLHNPPTGKITFKILSGMYRSLEDKKNVKEMVVPKLELGIEGS